MKKLFLLLSATMLTFSCSSDDDSTTNNPDPGETKMFVKKVTNISLADSEGNTDTYIAEFEYNDENKLSRIISGNGYTQLEYLNGKLASYTNYTDEVENSSGELIYIGEKLSHVLADDSGHIFRIDYTYSNDGKLKKFQQCSGTEPCTNNNSYTELTFENHNVTKEVRSSMVFGEPFITTYNYTYDTQKNPFDNYDEATRIMLKDLINAALSQNNYKTQTDYSGSLVNYTNTYTEEGFLKKQEGRYDSNGGLYVSFEYEYIEL